MPWELYEVLLVKCLQWCLTRRKFSVKDTEWTQGAGSQLHVQGTPFVTGFKFHFEVTQKKAEVFNRIKTPTFTFKHFFPPESCMVTMGLGLKAFFFFCTKIFPRMTVPPKFVRIKSAFILLWLLQASLYKINRRVELKVWNQCRESHHEP